MVEDGSTSSGSVDEHAASGRRRRLFGCASLLVLITLLLAISARDEIETPWSGHRRVPQPSGLVFQIEMRSVGPYVDCFRVYAIDRDGPAVAVIDDGPGGRAASARVFRYPDGHELGRLSLVETERIRQAHADDRNRRGAEFDFDGDGVPDRLEGGEAAEFMHHPSDYGRVRVLSGRDSSVLFEDWDPLEYECGERGYALGDLDGDGFAEIALVHPRMDRSRYDLELWDALFGAKSWISIVSGSRIAR